MRKICILLILISGCSPYVEPQGGVAPLQIPTRDYMLAIALDTSGSFESQAFGDDCRAYRLLTRAVDQLFRDRMGSDDHVLLAQLSDNHNALLWEGTPRDLTRKFGSSEALQSFIRQHGGGMSDLYAGVAQTLEYIYALPGVKDGETKVCVLILSDLLDNSATQDEDRKKMIEALDKLSDVQASVGFYFVDVSCLEEIRQYVDDVGLDPRFIEAGIVEAPPIPSFIE